MNEDYIDKVYKFLFNKNYKGLFGFRRNPNLPFFIKKIYIYANPEQV